MTLLDDLGTALGDGLLLDPSDRAARARDTWMRSQIPVSAGETPPSPVATASGSRDPWRAARAC